MTPRWNAFLASPSFPFFVGNQAVEGCKRNSHERTEVPKRINHLANQESKYVYANSCENPVPPELGVFLVWVIRHKQYGFSLR